MFRQERKHLFYVSIIFIFFFVYWRYKSNKIAEGIDAGNFTISDYSLYATNLPT